MIDMLVQDLDKEMQSATTSENDAQKDYEKLMEDAKAKRAADSKSIAEKESSKAELEGELQTHTDGKAAATKQAMATAEAIKNLHLDCDWLLANFQARKDARAGEVESLKNAKAVLSGADYSLVGISSKRNLLRKKTCPSTSVQTSMTKDAAGNHVFNEYPLPEPGTCVDIAATIPDDGEIKICGPGKFTLSRMSCDKHEYKSVTIEQASDSFTASDCKVYDISAYANIKGYVGSAQYTCDATSR